MDRKRKRRPVLKTLFATTVGLAASGWAAVEYGGVELPLVGVNQPADSSANTAPSPLDGIEQVWAEEALGTPVAQAAAPVAKPPIDKPADPFLARGQQPRGGAIDVPVSAELPTGNPLRGRYGSREDVDQQAYADQFAGGRYGNSDDDYRAGRDTPSRFNNASPIQVNLGPESRVQPAAAEVDDTPPELPAAAIQAVDGFENEPATLEPPAQLPGLPLVDVPIVPPTAPNADPSVAEPPAAELPAAEPSVVPSQIAPPRVVEHPTTAAPAARVATREPAYASPTPPSSPQTLPANDYDADSGLTPVEPPTGFGGGFDGSTNSTPAAPRPGDLSLDGRQQPSLALQKFAPKTVQIGKPCTFMLKVRNDSPRAVADVVVNDHTPAGARLVATKPTADTMGDAVRWEIGTLGPGEERTLEMEIIPTEEGEIGSVAIVSFAAQASARTSVTRPLLALRMSAPSQVLVGQEQRMLIEVRNPGTGDATNVVLVEDVPANLRHEAGSSVEFEIGTLRAGETRRLELVMNAEAAGPVSNVLTARADGGLEVQQQVDFDVVAPGLEVALQGPSRRYLQRPATYSVRVDNPGTAPAQDIRLVARLPRGMRFVKANNLGEYDPSTHAVYWALAELPEGEGGEVQLTALPTTAGEMTIEVEGEAGAGLRDQAVQQVRVEGVAAVDFEVLDVEDPIEVGGETAYEVRVSNQGTKEATDVQIRFVAPPGMRVLSANGPTRHTIDSRGVAFEPLARLAPRAENRYRIRVQADQAGDQRMMVEVTTSDLTQPVRKEEATRVFGDE